MHVLSTISCMVMVVVVVASELLPLTTMARVRRKTRDNPCAHAASGARICDPATNGTTYIACSDHDKSIYYVQHCPRDTFFNPRTQNCDWPWNIQDKCVAGPGSSQQPPGSSPTTPAPASGNASSTTSKTTPATVGTSTTTTLPPFPSGQCDTTTCKLPDCRCVGSDIPGNLTASDVPQMVLLTFDDAVNGHNFDYYEQLFPQMEAKALKNPNKCRTSATFFVSGSDTNMNLVKKLWDRGNEISSHSLTHRQPTWWTPQEWAEEMQGMRTKLAKDSGVPISQINGLRTPFLELGGETQFSMMQHHNFTYDSSMFGGSLNIKSASFPLWPFSLHYPPRSSQAVCDQRNCPMRSFPRVWEIPIIRQYNLDGDPCSMTDSCSFRGQVNETKVKQFLLQNFERHYSTNRAPFMISLHATWFSRVQGSFQGLRNFLSEVSGDPNVWQVTLSQMLEWVRQPVSLENLESLPSWRACG